MAKSTTAKPRETKSAAVLRLLSRKSGADAAALQEATGWQPHSIRAALSRLRKAGHTIERMPPKAKGRPISYRIARSAEGA